ncbi:3-hydroxyacyl-ACP dehydratase FabZ [Woodsholea maritima]|uniref:3-hydroxyacyl-ACP dehydratase FabZ n=1 Tax=Woodsholea maritima TaxID=240237 RepID=UPI0003725CB2|nr:3-hydroxyacyl-ACP dehydratase FabZ [Woodsholea maritima]
MSEASEVISHREILARLPHRPPFLLLDRADHFVSGQSITGYKAVTWTEPCFQGHFPDNPVFPGVMIIEAMAQTGALLMTKTLDVSGHDTTIYFMGIEKARFKRPVRPGDVMTMPVEIIVSKRGIFKFHGRVLVSDQLVTECEFSATAQKTNA